MLRLFLVICLHVLLTPCRLLATPISITVDPAQQQGRVFDGLGAISGGATTRLLVDYPVESRDEILDYLFKPQFGAALQILKVEIGGDTNSTCGAEASHMHARGVGSFDEGYEWWLMAEAKKRNPRLQLCALAWGAPGWLGNGQFYSDDTIDYIIGFIEGARDHHGLDIDCVGVWNERAYDTSWIKKLSRALKSHNLSTRLVAADGITDWSLAEAMRTDPELERAVDIIGSHYTRGLYPAPQSAQSVGKTLWDSEDGPWRADWTGAATLAATFNRNYIDSRITATQVWSLVTSYYDNLPLPHSGLMYANQPWSGSYEVQPAIWSLAHTTQFAQPGWRYLDDASAYLPAGGSYVGLTSPSREQWSIIFETGGATATASVDVTLKGAANTPTVSVWRSSAAKSFEKLDDLTAINGHFQLSLDPDAIYTVTNTAGQHKGETSSPPAAAFPFPYSDDGSTSGIGALPRYFSDQSGSFNLQPCHNRPASCLTQNTLLRPIEWTPTSEPLTVIGSDSWVDYAIEVDALFDKTAAARLIGRLENQAQDQVINGYVFECAGDGAWQIRDGKSGARLASGASDIAENSWHHLVLQFRGDLISASIDGGKLATVFDRQHRRGLAGLGSSWSNVQFSDFKVRASEEALSLVDGNDAASKAVAALFHTYSIDTGLWADTNWWNAANALSALIDYMRLSNDRAYEWVLDNTYRRNSSGHFLNDYYDDEGWWAMAWLDAYDFTKDARYLDAAKTLFTDMTNAWDETCQGGVWWNHDRQYKNAVTNQLFMAVAARLALNAATVTERRFFEDWAARERAWFDGSGLVGSDGLVSDGLDAACANNGGTAWTYNQGLFLADAIAWSQLTGDQTIVTNAAKVADATILQLTDHSGVLIEACEQAGQNCGADGPSFKGIFVRYLRRFAEATTKPGYAAFLNKNSNSILAHSSNEHWQFGLGWNAGFDRSDAARQHSAVDLLNSLVTGPTTNAALWKSVETDARDCAPNEGSRNLTDGSLLTKWCTGASPSQARIDLGAVQTIDEIKVSHAGSGGEASAWNTAGMSVETSVDGSDWIVRGAVAAPANQTIHAFMPSAVRYLRLRVFDAGVDHVTRIYEVEASLAHEGDR